MPGYFLRYLALDNIGYRGSCEDGRGYVCNRSGPALWPVLAGFQ